MLRKNLRFRSALVFILGVSLLCLGTSAQADGHRRDTHRHHRDREYRYHHRDGGWYAHEEIIVPSVHVVVTR